MDYQAIFENLQVGLHIYHLEDIDDDSTLRMVGVNQAAADFIGVPVEDVVGKTLDENFPGLREKGVPQKYAGVVRSGESITMEEVYYSDNRIVQSVFIVKAFPLPNNCVGVSSENITGHRKAEDELKKKKAQLTSLVDNLFDALVVTDRTGTIQFVNSAACRLFGRARDRLVGNEFGFPVTLDKMFEITVNQPNGKIRYAEARGVVADWDDKLAYLISLRDITKRKLAMAEREKMNVLLQQIQKIESIGTLAGGMAHDFNNMLSVILGYAEDLLYNLPQADPLRESVKEIIEAARRSADLTRQLLAFSRKQVLQPEVLDLNDLVRNLEKMLGRIIGEDIELKTLLAEDLGPVEVDPGQFEQVIVNLAVNARDAMPQGGKLTIATTNIELDERYADTRISVTPGSYVSLSVTDNGCGMGQDTRTKVFEPFFTTKEKGKGTGLGLSTVYGIVKQSGGNIWVYSEPGQGTTFKIYLPQTTAELSGKKGPKDADSTMGKGQRVLLVEDEPSLRVLCEKILKSLNYNVTVAANGSEALFLVEDKKLHPDLIVTDVVMPEMGGKVMVDRLKKNLPNIKVLYMSGYTDDAIVHHGILDSGTPFIQKPFTKDKLGKIVKAILAEQ